MKISRALLLILLLCAAPAGAADTEARAAALFTELRCPVCRGQDIGSSAAPLAADLRRLVRAQLEAGKTEAEILSFLQARYGDSILMRPPLRGGTALLWFMPLLAGAAGLFAFAAVVRRRRGGR